MKSIKDIDLEISTIREALKMEEQERKTINAGFDKIDLKKLHEYWKANKDHLHDLDTSIKRKEIALAILKNNKKLAIFSEVMPIALEVFYSFSDKPYGKKTKQKIANMIEEKTGYCVYISRKYGSEIFRIYYDYGQDIECSTKYNNGNQKHILIDNKIQEISFDDLEVWCIKSEYIENVSDAVDKLIELNAEAVKIQNQLKEVCSAFNALACDGIENMCEYKIIYPLIK